jgi:polysaccharide biosynthesis protein PslG
MAILGVLNSTPGWGAAQGSGGWGLGAEPDPVKYAAYAEAVADRYKGLVSAYEIWNEPNAVPYWTPGPDPVAYTKVLKAAYAAINRADPNALVVAGVLGAITDYEVGGELIGMDARSFVAAMYANDAHGSFDALSFHPYQYTTKFSEGGGLAFSPINQLNDLQKRMSANGDGGKKIWTTEYGEPASVVDEATQAAYLTDFLTKWRTLPYAGPAYLYTTRDRNTGSGAADDTFGVYRSDWTPKPAQQAVQSLT